MRTAQCFFLCPMQVSGGREVEQILYFTPGRDEATAFSQLKQQGIKIIPNTDIRSDKLKCLLIRMHTKIVLCFSYHGEHVMSCSYHGNRNVATVTATCLTCSVC